MWEDPDDNELSIVVTYCTPCAERELEATSRQPGTI
jgi:hypothetical protein